MSRQKSPLKDPSNSDDGDEVDGGKGTKSGKGMMKFGNKRCLGVTVTDLAGAHGVTVNGVRIAAYKQDLPISFPNDEE